MAGRIVSSLLLRAGHIYSPEDPFASAILVVDGEVAWIGDEGGADVHAADMDAVVHLQGALVTPAFVDAHVHTTSTGLTLTGLDLTGTSSMIDCLHALRSFTAPGSVILGHGWDESTWPDGRVPTTAEIDAAVGDIPVYLTRIDVHSALVSSALRRMRPDAVTMRGWDPTGPVSREAHHALRDAALGMVSADHRSHAQQMALGVAASRGIASVHENGGPSISSRDDFLEVLHLGADPQYPEVIGYWGRLHGQDEAAALGARGAAGDLFVDGSLGSHTACLLDPYADQRESRGTAYLDADDVAEHIVASTEAGQQGGFHVIGDGATQIVADGFSLARRRICADRLRAARHRLEHLEMPSSDHLRFLADIGVVASVQPAFDAAWGGPSGMYSQRLGATRAQTLNPFAHMTSAGVVLAFGSDAPVTPLDPWGSVRAAAWHHTVEHRISVRSAFAAHTRGGRRAARDEAREPGVLMRGAPATYAIWAPGPLAVQAPDGRVAAWSTDPRSGTPPLPDLQGSQPVCWRTVRAGAVIFDSGDLDGGATVSGP